MSLSFNHLYEFGEFRLDPREKVLMRCGEFVELTPKGFELLCVLVESHGRLLEKDTLMDKIWANSFVEESNLTFNIRQLRIILGDDAQNPKYIKTVRGHGYRFIAPVNTIFEESLPTTIKKNLSATSDEATTLENSIEDESAEITKTNSKSVSKTAGNSFSQPFFKSKLAIIFLVVLLASTLAGALILSGKFRSRELNVPILDASFKSSKLSNTGGVGHAVISPDGKWMGYISESGGKYGIWIRNLQTSENVQLISNSDNPYGGIGFSHDGETLYFARITEDRIQIIYRISVRGGVPKEIVKETQGWFSLSPDDSQISFVRCPYQENDYCSLFIADVDGKNERKILTRPRPIRIGDNQFSPDGKSIAVALGQSRTGSQDFSLIEVDAQTGKEREITKQKFFNIKYITWLPDQSGLLFTANETFNRVLKIYQVLYQTGEVKTLTNDSNSYDRISLDNSFQTMVATQVLSDFYLWIAPTDDLNSAKRLCDAQIARFTGKGKIIYSSVTDDSPNIWEINTDGTNQRQLTSNQESNANPLPSLDERYIYFSSNRSGSTQIWRMNTDGSNQMQISEGESGIPIFVSPDGNTIFYVTNLNSNLGKITINSDGSKVSDIVSKERMFLPAINPSGEKAAYFSRKEDSRYEIILMSLTDGKILKSFRLADENPAPLKIVWAVDGKSLFYLTENILKSTIWQLSPETGKFEKFIEFSGDEEVSDFTFSPDGKTFAYIRGKWRHDALLIEGLK